MTSIADGRNHGPHEFSASDPGRGWKGMAGALLHLPLVPLSWSATITISRKKRDTLMCLASTSVWPAVLVLCTRSDPARSTWPAQASAQTREDETARLGRSRHARDALGHVG